MGAKKFNKTNTFLLIIILVILVCLISSWFANNILFDTDKYNLQLEKNKLALESFKEKQNSPIEIIEDSFPINTESRESSNNEICICSYNTYNCADFNSKAEAEECFDYCKSQGKGDVHHLDRDEDNKPCETLN